MQDSNAILNRYGYYLNKTVNLSDSFQVAVYRKENEKEVEYVLLDHFFVEEGKPVFDYSKYTLMQNELMSQSATLYRFVGNDTLFSKVTSLFEESEQNLDQTKHIYRDQTYQDVSPAEHQFELRFEETYGSEYLIALEREYPLIDLENRNGFIDYVIETKRGLIGFEVNGVSYHHPLIIGIERYQKQLDKQNAAMKSGIKMYRFSSNDTLFKEKMQEQLLLYIGAKHTIIARSLIEQRRGYTLYEHQADTIDTLKKNFANGDKAALVVLPTASGKSTIVEELILDMLLEDKHARIAILAPNTAIIEDWKRRIFRLETMTMQKMDGIEVLSYLAFHKTRQSKQPTYYQAIFMDEAHHAVASTMRKTLQYYNPKRLVGITATPERMDKQRLEEVFGTYQSDLSLQEAMEQGMIAQARVYRIETNLDLSEVRYNGKSYVNADLERAIRVESRNHLIVSVLEHYFKQDTMQNKKGLIFCVNVAHAKEMERCMRAAGFDARAVFGGDKKSKEYIQGYQHGDSPKFLCSCNLVSEGWDAPDTQVLVMARPTMSKVLYLQQLGRGLRNYPGKEAVYVFDVVDTYGALLKPFSTHAIFQQENYVPMGNILTRYQIGDMIHLEGLVERVEKIQPVDIHSFEDLYSTYLSEEEFARILYIDTNTLKNWVKKGEIEPNLRLPFGNRMISMFHPDQVQEIRILKGLEIHDESTLRVDFISFAKEYSYSYSFKMIFMLALLSVVDLNGEADIKEVLALYQTFYLERISLGLQVDRESCVYTKTYLEDTKQLQKSMLENPFEKFERKHFIMYSKELGKIDVHPMLWSMLTRDDIQEIKDGLIKNLEQYYQAMGGVQDISWLIGGKENETKLL
ncbi:MAG: DEAD/DEAH box helicase [Erysipelotrichaceae bacterium]